MTVSFPVPPEVAFDYLVDPANRAQWQSSLRRVEEIDGEPRVGQTWVDVTVPGLRPQMRTTVYDRARRWSETGTWRGVRADLTLVFSPTASGCEVEVDFRIHALGPVGRLLTRVSAAPVRADLRSAARILAAR